MPKGKLSDEQVLVWEQYLAVKNDERFTNEQLDMVCEIHADVFAHPYKKPKCTRCSAKKIKKWRDEIHQVYEDRNSN
jgi:hypothetical protein